MSYIGREWKLPDGFDLQGEKRENAKHLLNLLKNEQSALYKTILASPAFCQSGRKPSHETVSLQNRLRQILTEKYRLGEEDTERQLKKGLYFSLLSVILASRGITTDAEASEFLSLSVDTLLDPFLLTDMNKAVDRINRAISGHEKVLVFGDYDVDGMTSTCVMLDYLRSCGLADAEYYIPDRNEGYGLNCTALKDFADRGCSLVITVDCGVTAVSEVSYAGELGLDVIITDHHECKDELPAAVAVIDPKRPDCSYPCKDLAGVGVAFKTICAHAGPDHAEELLLRFSEYTALGTVADVVPIVGENRVLVSQGLEALPRTGSYGLRTLLENTGVTQKRMNTTAIGFTIAPVLNAAGRMGNVARAIDLIRAESPESAAAAYRRLADLNEERKGKVERIYREALAMAEGTAGPLILDKVSEDVRPDGWWQGVMGIVAARIAELRMVPTIMVCVDENGIGHGSCRSFADFSLYAALESCSEYLVNFGGHKMAAGITIEQDKIASFRDAFTEYYNRNKPGRPYLSIDYEVCRRDLLTPANVEVMTAALEPCGTGNPAPVLCIRDARLTMLTPVGEGGRHSKLRIAKNEEEFDGIFFSHGPDQLKEQGISTESRVDIAFEPQINEFRGRRSVQLLVVDIKPHR